jgi:pyruvate,water dikinase
MEREQTQRRQTILRELESHLNPLSKRLLNELLKLIHALIPVRQNMRALSLMQAHMARRVTQQMESHLLRTGTLSAEQDIYFLTTEELDELLQPSARSEVGSRLLVPETRKRIERRKEEFHRNLDVVLPVKFLGRPEPIFQPAPCGNRKGEKRLRGIPASPGRVTGQARKITTPVQDVQIRPGEILILPGMDAGWTPLFPAASAIVAERGGMLSHGSILAREFGIPAITSISDATSIIQTGQVITVDGERGEVWL